jgi:hypothetical protein
MAFCPVVAVVMLERWVRRCVHCEEEVKQLLQVARCVHCEEGVKQLLQVARCVHCGGNQATSSSQCTHLAIQLSSITTATTGQKAIGSVMQFDLLMMGIKTPETG